MCLTNDLTQARREIKAILIEKALHHQDITYGALAQNISSCRIEPDSPELHGLLGEISEQESLGGRGMLSVLVVRKDNRYPGKGFFTCAQGIGHDIDVPKQERNQPPMLEKRHKDFCREMKNQILNYYANPLLKMKIAVEIRNNNGNIRAAFDALEAAGVV
jgi:hypothetical protein